MQENWKELGGGAPKIPFLLYGSLGRYTRTLVFGNSQVASADGSGDLSHIVHSGWIHLQRAQALGSSSAVDSFRWKKNLDGRSA